MLAVRRTRGRDRLVLGRRSELVRVVPLVGGLRRELLLHALLAGRLLLRVGLLLGNVDIRGRHLLVVVVLCLLELFSNAFESHFLRIGNL